MIESHTRAVVRLTSVSGTAAAARRQPLDEIEAYADDPLNGRVRLVSVPRADALAPPDSRRSSVFPPQTR